MICYVLNQFSHGIKIKARGSLLTKRFDLYPMSGAPPNEVKDEPQLLRRMRSSRFYECGRGQAAGQPD